MSTARFRSTRLRVPAMLLVSFVAPNLTAAQSIDGFGPATSARQLACEARLRPLPSSEAFRTHLRTITSEPHPTGSAANARVAEYLASVMTAAGFTVQRPAYDVYLPTLDGSVEIELVTPVARRLSNKERVLEADPYSGHPALKEGWNAYAGSGDVTGEVVYVNYGRKEDFDALGSLGVSVEGKIALARYGGNFRGFKAKFAEANGAIGLIMFNDPDTSAEEPYPAGRGMNETTVQRGSVLTLPYTGDPLTPFEPALPRESNVSVDRLDPADVAFHTIPIAPIPYGSAIEILNRMRGEAAPADWRGGLAAPYRLTGGPEVTVRLAVDQPRALVRATNVIGTLTGSEFPDEWVILGSHYDAWGFGAVDPNGGTAMLLTLAEALGQLALDGCPPRRSVMIGHWDAEEYGIIGSVEWVEQMRAPLTANAVAYINADGAVSGPNFSASASPSLKGLIETVARSVTYPGTSLSVYDRWVRSAGSGLPTMGSLGGGSDHVGFYTHVGVPSGGLSFGGSSPIYHSNYDNFAWYERFGDRDFVFGPALARVDGILALRLANADILPYDVARYAVDLRELTSSMQTLAASYGLSTSLAALDSATAVLADAAAEFERARDGALVRGPLAESRARSVNGALIGLEKAFLHPDGLQDRPWSKSLYASPDPFSGYASWMLPGLRYEIETGNVVGLERWVGVYVAAVEDLTRRIRQVASLVQR